MENSTYELFHFLGELQVQLASENYKNNKKSNFKKLNESNKFIGLEEKISKSNIL